MKKFVVQLINRELGRSHPPRSIQDRNGIKIGLSKWNPLFNCHALTEPISIEEYNGNVADRLARVWHLALMRWQPRFIEIEVAETVSSGGTGQTHTVVGNATEEELRKMKHFSRTAIAKKLGLDPKQYKGSGPLVVAILEAQAAIHE